jgi:hypothetical protein
MLPITYAYEKEKFADVLRHVEEERRRMDPLWTLPAPRTNRLFHTLSAALLQIVSFIFG